MAVADAGKPRVDVVIPTWDGKDLLADCLQSLVTQRFRRFETTVVDDGSTDGTEEMLAMDFPWARTIRLAENRGFCRAVNAGIRESQAELVLLLNNDMTLDPDFLAHLVHAADASRAALFAPLVLWRHDPHTIYSAGDRQRANGRPESIGFRYALDGFVFKQNVFGVSAGAALYRRAVFDRIGLFDERFDCYFSDSDLSFRARLAGFTAAFVQDAVAYHVGSASFMGANWKRNAQCHRNHVLLVLKNMPSRLLLRYGPGIVIEHARQTRGLFSAARCRFGAVGALSRALASYVKLAKALPHAIAERRRIQRMRTLATQDLAALLGDRREREQDTASTSPPN